MDKSLNTSHFTKHKKSSGIAMTVRGILSAAIAFSLSMLLLPLILSKTETPEKFIAIAAVFTVALTCFSCAFAANIKNEKGFLLRGSVCALAIILILVILSLVFGNGTEDKNYMFSAILYISCFVFSLLGARLSMARKNKKRRKR